MAKAESQGRGGAEETKGTILSILVFDSFFINTLCLTVGNVLYQEKQAKRKVTRADEEKRLAQKKKEEEERRQREIGNYTYVRLCFSK